MSECGGSTLFPPPGCLPRLILSCPPLIALFPPDRFSFCFLGHAGLVSTPGTWGGAMCWFSDNLLLLLLLVEVLWEFGGRVVGFTLVRSACFLGVLQYNVICCHYFIIISIAVYDTSENRDMYV